MHATCRSGVNRFSHAQLIHKGGFDAQWQSDRCIAGRERGAHAHLDPLGGHDFCFPGVGNRCQIHPVRIGKGAAHGQGSVFYRCDAADHDVTGAHGVDSGNHDGLIGKLQAFDVANAVYPIAQRPRDVVRDGAISGAQAIQGNGVFRQITVVHRRIHIGNSGRGLQDLTDDLQLTGVDFS